MKNSLKLIRYPRMHPHLYKSRNAIYMQWMQFKYSVSHRECQKPLHVVRMKHSFSQNCQLIVKHSNHYFRMHAFHWRQPFYCVTIHRTQFFFCFFILEFTWSNVMSSYLPPLYRYNVLFKINNSVCWWTKMEIFVLLLLLLFLKPCFFLLYYGCLYDFPQKLLPIPNDGTSVHCQLVIVESETCDRQSEI